MAYSMFAPSCWTNSLIFSAGSSLMPTTTTPLVLKRLWRSLRLVMQARLAALVVFQISTTTMFVPGLTSTGWPLIHSLTFSDGAGSPTKPPNPILGARPAIRTTIGNTYLIIFISNEFIHDRRLAQVPKFCCWSENKTGKVCASRTGIMRLFLTRKPKLPGAGGGDASSPQCGCDAPVAFFQTPEP